MLSILLFLLISIFFLTLLQVQEEREKRLEEVFESALDNLNEDRYAPKELVPDEGSVGVPGKETKETLSATDLIIDALDMADAEIKRMDQHKVQINLKYV